MKKIRINRSAAGLAWTRGGFQVDASESTDTQLMTAYIKWHNSDFQPKGVMKVSYTDLYVVHVKKRTASQLRAVGRNAMISKLRKIIHSLEPVLDQVLSAGERIEIINALDHLKKVESNFDTVSQQLGIKVKRRT